MEELQQFHAIVAGLLSTNNQERDAAEKQYNDVSTSQKTVYLHQLGIDSSVRPEVSVFL